MPSNKKDDFDQDAQEIRKSTDEDGFIKDSQLNNQDLGGDLDAGFDPETPLTSHDSMRNQDDPWKNSLANDELRAPDS